jgi:outer membrane protein TolC
VALAARDYWPDVTLSLNWYEIDTAGISPVANGQDAYSMGVGVNLPLCRSRLDAAVREARYRTASSTRQYALTRDELRTEVQSLYAQFLEHDQVLEILDREILPRAGQALDLSIEAYRTGQVAFEQLIDTYRTLLEYRIDHRRRQAMREQAVAALERAVGCVITGESSSQ